jgi:2-oxoglutarate dehydrogenase E1 component
LLRRQALSLWRKPLVVLTPKSMLRLPAARSPLAHLAEGVFQRVIPDTGSTDLPGRILLCAGKIYHELAKWRAEEKRADVAIVRLEQLYPLPAGLLEKALARYPAGTPVVWTQEEPLNMGAWPHLWMRFGATIDGRFPFHVVARSEAASPATGSAAAHKLEQEFILKAAFGAAQTSSPK